jgi:hypothetical protein
MDISYKGKLFSFTLDLSAKTLKARKAKNDIFQVMIVNNLNLDYYSKESFLVSCRNKDLLR